MQTTSHDGWGALYRYNGFYFALLLGLIILILPIIEPSYSKSYLGFFVILFCVLCYQWIYLWVHAIVKIENDGLEIKRLGMVKRKVKWDNLRLFKKLRTITRLGTIGLDPRYVILEIKDGMFADRYVILLPFFKGYDGFIAEIESHINRE